MIQEKFQDAIDTDGVHSICYVTGSGNFGAMHGPSPSAFFAHLGGASTTVGSLCCAGTSAAEVLFTDSASLTRATKSEEQCIRIAWGNNPATSKQGYFQRFEKMMENGGKFVVIDPICTESAAKASEWIQPWPGTDAALALA